MPISRNARLAILSLVAVMFVLYLCTIFFVRGKPLGDSPHIPLPAVAESPEEIEQFLSGDFVMINRVERLPKPVQQFYKEVEGNRYTVANPGRRFNATDVIYDASIPMKRLIFAGASGDKCFVHYEHGGIGLHSDLDLFRLISLTQAEPIWKGTCGDVSGEAIKDLAGLKRLVASGECRDGGY